MNVAIVSLIVLISVIAISFILKANVGLMAILAACIFGTFIGYEDKLIIAGFSANLFVMMLGVSFLCAVAISNQSLELMAKKFLKLTGGRAFLTPILIYVIGFSIAAVGPGCVPALGIVAALSLPLGKSTGYNSIMLAVIGQMGSFSGRFSPITPESVLIQSLAEAQGIEGYQTAVIIYSVITTIVLSIFSFVYFKGYKVKNAQMEAEVLPGFNRGQILTLIGFVIVIIASAAFGRNVGLIAFAVGIALVVLKAADEKKVFQTVSWSTLLVVTGVGMLMEMVISSGGITLLSESLASIMRTRTAIAIQGLTAGIMSWFSSAIGVVWPTLVPTVKSIADSVGVSANGLISIMCLTASFAGLSPASTGGGLIMAVNATEPSFTKKDENKLFIQLFVLSAIMLMIILIAALFGLYDIL